MNLHELATSDEVKAHAEKEVKKALRHLGTINPHRGQSMWELNLSTGIIELATFNEATIDFKGGIRKKLIVKEGFYYCTALNKRNAFKKFSKMLYGTH